MAWASLPSVVLTSRSLPRLPLGSSDRRWSSSRSAPARRLSATLTSEDHLRVSVTRTLSASCLRTPRLPPPPPSPRPSRAMPCNARDTCSGRVSERPASLRRWAAMRRFSGAESSTPISGAISRIRSISFRSSSTASVSRFREERRTPTCTNAVNSVSLLAIPKQAVDRDAGDDAVCLKSCDLVGHQRHQRRDDHGHRPGLVVSGQSRYLVAQRLACAGRQDSQNMPARH